MSNLDGVLRILLVAAAAAHMVTIPALALAPRWGILDRAELRRLSPVNVRIVLVVMLTIQGILIASSATVIWALDEILAGGRLAVAVTACLAALWSWRLGAQFWYGALFHGRPLRLLHGGLLLLFGFMALTYGGVLVHLLRQPAVFASGPGPQATSYNSPLAQPASVPAVPTRVEVIR
jgi:hypothetical protein